MLNFKLCLGLFAAAALLGGCASSPVEAPDTASSTVQETEPPVLEPVAVEEPTDTPDIPEPLVREDSSEVEETATPVVEAMAPSPEPVVHDIAEVPEVAVTMVAFAVPLEHVIPTLPFGTVSVGLETSEVHYRLDRGLLLHSENGESWSAISENLPHRILYPFSEEEGFRITGWSVDASNPENLAVSGPGAVYLSDDGGYSWQAADFAGATRPSAYFTAVARSGDRIAVGTSFHGLYESLDAGTTWQRLADGALPYRGAGFYEEVADLIYQGNHGDLTVLLAYNLGFRERRDGRWTSSSQSLPVSDEEFRSMKIDESGQLILLSATEEWRQNEGEEWSRTGERLPLLDIQAAARRQLIADWRAAYLPLRQTRGQDLEDFLDFLESKGYNAVVVDMKDDLGRVTYDSQVPLAREIGAVRPIFDLDALMETAHRRGFKVIARVVVFKDQALFGHQDGLYALRDTRSGGPWGHLVAETLADGSQRQVQREFWVDPFADAVWDYNAQIAEELQAAGLDEIQFDYIRFPSDGETWAIRSAYQRDGMERLDALESFLRVVRERVTAPISTDLYGFNCYFRMGNWIGQDMEMISHYVDAISPMFYPSHFPRTFLEEMAYIPRSREIYREGTQRSVMIVENRSLIRPWVQAFLIGGERNFEEATYHAYFTQQIDGAVDGGASGWCLWNMSGNYSMIP